MLVIEYLNVLTSGTWQQRITQSPLGQYLFAAFMGVIPGCLGAFAVAAMYSHRMVTLGAVVATMIATSGDEAFVMLAVIPGQALLVNAILFVVAVLAGMLVDVAARRLKIPVDLACEGLQLHTRDTCRCYPAGEILAQLRNCSPFRALLMLVLAGFLFAAAVGTIGPPEWGWVRISILVVAGLGLFIVTTVPDHFLEEHLWNHVARKHVPRIFLWTFGTLLLMQLITGNLHLEGLIRANPWVVLLIAAAVGIIPESGPHLVIVMLFAEGSIPLSILLASSAVQDGHGMLPLLAHSRKAFVVIKLINLLVGLILGAGLLLFGW
jgi:hypothetical protein